MLRWFHFGEGEYVATEEAIQAELEADSGSLPDPLEPLRPGDAPGAKVIAPTAELFPGGSEREPWRATREQPGLELDFAAGGASAVLDGTGHVEVRLDGEALEPLHVAYPGLHELAPDGPHREGRLELRPDRSVTVYSIAFAAGVP